MPEEPFKLSLEKALELEMLWQSASEDARNKYDAEYPDAVKLIEDALGRKMEIA